MAHLQILPSINDRVDPLVERFLDMREKLRWMLAMGGERVLLYKRLYSGELSPYYDPIRKTVKADPTDFIGYGTPFVGGFYGPFEIFVSLQSGSTPQQITSYDQGLRRTFNAVGNWALWEPQLNNKDFIVRRNNQRLWITDVDISKWRHHVLHYSFKTTEIERSNVIYNIPITGLADTQTGLVCPITPLPTSPPLPESEVQV
jgi:hypothetical protein